MAKTTTAKAGAKKAAPAKAAAAAKEPVKAAKRTGNAAPAAAKTAGKPASTRTTKVAQRAVKAPAKAPVKAAATPAAKPARPTAGTNVAMKAARKLVVKPVPAARPLIEDAAKPQLVRDSFTMPEQEYAALAAIKHACLKAGFEIKKSELLRIGVALASQLDIATLQGVLAGLPQLKTGRPRSR